ncbi:MAG: hypothetical protein Tsb0013_06380 [Phycisphaerales bacterium]
MRRWMTGLVLCCLAMVCGAVASPPANPDTPQTLEEMLGVALDDERHAIAFYQAVMQEHGVRPPFSNIVRAEQRHASALLAQYERLGYEVPPDRWADHTFDVPATFRACCDLSVVSEVRNGRLYERMIDALDDEAVRRLFISLRRASVDRHLPAFRRHSSMWQTIKPETMTPQQREQFERAERARTDMFTRLQSELSSAIETDGVTGAIAVCAQRAPAIASEIGEAHALTIGRTSHKLRNPDNTPPIWAELLIDEHPSEPQLVLDRDGRMGVLTPITIAPACLRCHADASALRPEVLDALRNTYPDDRATGYELGDLRGWFWVEAPPTQPSTAP